MSKWQGSNLRSLVPKTSGLPTFLHLEVIVLINGLEPITSTVSGGCSNQLSYINIFLDPRTGIEPISSAYKAVASPTKLTRNLFIYYLYDDNIDYKNQTFLSTSTVLLLEEQYLKFLKLVHSTLFYQNQYYYF